MASEIVAARSAYDIIKTASSGSAQVAFLSGTINPKSAENLATFLNKRFNRKVKVVKTDPNDPQSVNKTQLRVVSDNSMRTDAAIADKVVDWINHGETGNAVVFFSKQRIDNVIELAKKKLTARSLDSLGGKSNEDYVKKADIQRYVDSLKLLGKSKEEIDELVKRYERKNYPESQSAEIERIKKIPGASQIKNKKARDAVTYGISYIYTQDTGKMSQQERSLGNENLSEQDKIILANLFSNKQTKVLLATTAIGIGVNVKIKDLYLPTIFKTESGTGPFDRNLEKMNKLELSQLLNRAGRGEYSVSTIHVPDNAVEYVRSVIQMKNQDYDVVPSINTFDDDAGTKLIMSLSKSVPDAVNPVLKSVAYSPTGMKFKEKFAILRSKIQRNFDLASALNQQQSDLKKFVDEMQDTNNQRNTEISKANDELIAMELRWTNNNFLKNDDIKTIIRCKTALGKVNDELDRLGLALQAAINAGDIQERDRIIGLIDRIQDRYNTLTTSLTTSMAAIDTMLDNRINAIRQGPDPQLHQNELHELEQIKNEYNRVIRTADTRVTLNNEIKALMDRNRQIDNEITTARQANNMYQVKILENEKKRNNSLIKNKTMMRNVLFAQHEEPIYKEFVHKLVTARRLTTIGLKNLIYSVQQKLNI